MGTLVNEKHQPELLTVVLVAGRPPEGPPQSGRRPGQGQTAVSRPARTQARTAPPWTAGRTQCCLRRECPPLIHGAEPNGRSSL